MDPQLQAILNFLAGGNPTANSSGGEYGLQTSLPQNTDMGGGGGDQSFGMQGFSPVNTNPNYANTIQKFFNYNPVAGPRPFSSTPLTPGAAGQNSSRGNSGWSSFMPNDPSSIMKTLSGEQ